MVGAPASPAAGGQEKPRVRSFFPETWFWMDGVTGDDGTLSLETQVPDSITSWSLYSFALSRELGLGISPVSELSVVKPFFVSLDLPYSATFGEVIPINLALYNYDQKAISIDLSLKTGGSSEAEFEVVDSPSRFIVTVEPGRVKAATVFIRPKIIGPLALLVEALGPGHSDAIKRELLIEAPGVRERVMRNIVVNHRNQGVTEARIDLAPPNNTFPGSERAVLTVTGDFMGPTLQGLDSLLQMPTGCGEQNMLNFAPDVFVTRYLKLTKQAKPDIERKALDLMLTGYQRELTYVHRDGSLSAFGDRDPSGSMWLTGFVLKTFAQAKGLIYIDERVLHEAAGWIMAHIAADGSFPSVGQVIHTSDLMGGEKGLLANTAFIVVALLEAGHPPQTLEKSLLYLESQVSAQKSDIYTSAITSYALILGGRPQAASFLATLKQRAMVSKDGASAHWSTSLSSPSATETGSCLYCAGSVSNLDIEATAYALLALVKHQDAEFAPMVAKWLMQQRTSNGGFLSTQDTCVGLQALTAYVERAYSTEANLQVRLRVSSSDPVFSKKLQVTRENFNVLQQVELPTGGELEVIVEGTGTAVLQTELVYNPRQEPGTADPLQPFNIQVKIRKLPARPEERFEVQSCVEVPSGQPDPGMTLLEVGLPTGFTASRAEVETLMSTHAVLKRVEIADRQVILYLNGLQPGRRFCLEIPVFRTMEVKDLQPSVSTVFAYYSPHLRATHITQPPE